MASVAVPMPAPATKVTLPPVMVPKPETAVRAPKVLRFTARSPPAVMVLMARSPCGALINMAPLVVVAVRLAAGSLVSTTATALICTTGGLPVCWASCCSVPMPPAAVSLTCAPLTTPLSLSCSISPPDVIVVVPVLLTEPSSRTLPVPFEMMDTFEAA